MKAEKIEDKSLMAKDGFGQTGNIPDCVIAKSYLDLFQILFSNYVLFAIGNVTF